MITIAQCILDPRLAARVAALLVGEPELGDVLERVCTREAPQCAIVGVHEGDRWMHASAWRMAVRSGDLDPQRCGWHRLDAGAWSTRGAFGTVAAFTVHHLGACVPPWVLDIPLVGALAAARRATAPACRRAPACRSWRGW